MTSADTLLRIAQATVQDAKNEDEFPDVTPAIARAAEALGISEEAVIACLVSVYEHSPNREEN